MDFCFICGMAVNAATDGTGRKICPICGNILVDVILQTPSQVSDTPGDEG